MIVVPVPEHFGSSPDGGFNSSGAWSDSSLVFVGAFATFHSIRHGGKVNSPLEVTYSTQPVMLFSSYPSPIAVPSPTSLHLSYSRLEMLH